MFVVDTNVLVYGTDEDAADHAAYRRLVEMWCTQSSAWYTTWAIFYEFLRVVSHPRVLRKPRPIAQAVDMVRALLASPGLAVLTETERHEAILTQTVKEVAGLHGGVSHDLHTVVLMREHGIRRIVTRDTGFHRFPFVEVVDPLRADWSEGVRERPAIKSRYATNARLRRRISTRG